MPRFGGPAPRTHAALVAVLLACAPAEQPPGPAQPGPRAWPPRQVPAPGSALPASGPELVASVPPLAPPTSRALASGVVGTAQPSADVDRPGLGTDRVAEGGNALTLAAGGVQLSGRVQAPPGVTGTLNIDLVAAEDEPRTVHSFVDLGRPGRFRVYAPRGLGPVRLHAFVEGREGVLARGLSEPLDLGDRAIDGIELRLEAGAPAPFPGAP